MIKSIQYTISLLPKSLITLICCHLFILILFFISRLIFLVYFFDDLLISDYINYIKSFLIGLRLDLIISSFFLLPVLLTIYFPYIGWNSPKYRYILSWYLITISGAIIIFCSINLEWFNEFGNHINTMIIMYGGTGESWDLILEEYNIFLYLILWALMIFCIFRIVKFSVDKLKYINPPKKSSLFFSFIFSLLITFVLIRGGTQERPLDWGYAYFSDSNMANSTAQNPVFFFGRSYVQMKKEAKYNNEFLRVDNPEEVSSHYQTLRLDSEKDGFNGNLIQLNDSPPNIVLIILESFVSRNCNFLNSNLDQNITPFLSELIDNNSISFTNCFANGIRSAYGLGSILTSWPVLPGNPIISQVESGFSENSIKESMNIFPNLGYHRTFLYGGDANFDNMKGFCIANGFNSVIDSKHPMVADSKDGTMWGYYDHIMLNHLIDIANTSENEPFMITFFSTTNHDPFKIPEDYEKYFQHIKTGNKKYLKAQKTMAYNDLVLREFFEQAKKEDWYDNTIFIITADHGLTINRDITNHPRNGHIPFIIFSELITKPVVIDKIVSQIDIMPTIIDLINQDNYLPVLYGISGLKGGDGFACRISSDNLQWITKNNLYNELMGQNNQEYFSFNNIWDIKYKRLTLGNTQLKIDSNLYIKNAYYKFKHGK